MDDPAEVSRERERDLDFAQKQSELTRELERLALDGERTQRRIEDIEASIQSEVSDSEEIGRSREELMDWLMTCRLSERDDWLRRLQSPTWRAELEKLIQEADAASERRLIGQDNASYAEFAFNAQILSNMVWRLNVRRELSGENRD